MVAYADLIAARIVNERLPGSIDIQFTDDKAAAASTFDGDSTKTFDRIITSFPKVFPDSVPAASWTETANKELTVKNFQQLAQSLE